MKTIPGLVPSNVYAARDGRMILDEAIRHGSVNWPEPDMGRHNDEVYSDLLGYDNARLEMLKKDGII